VASVLEQSYDQVEYIVVDGGSTDGGADYLKSVSDQLDYWVSEPDKGIYNAMNKGAKQASGEYLLFLNSGDWLIKKNVIAKVVQSGLTADIVYGNIVKVNQGKAQEPFKGPGEAPVTMHYMYRSSLNHPSSFIAKSIFDKIGGYDENYKIVSDWYFFFKAIFKENASLKYIDINTTYFDITGISSADPTLSGKEKDVILKQELTTEQYQDYLFQKNLLKSRPKAKEYDIIKSKKLLWFIVRAYFKLFRVKLK
jgi:glycosyltransferase involved in cell wall biosynthesis